jgi:hypothetical protein
MGYDLMVFEPSEAPRERNAFLDWYRFQTQWSEDHSYDDPATTTAGLSAWLAEMRRDFPNVNMNGRGAYDISNDEDNPRVTDYSISRSVIYAAFSWTEVESAYSLARALAVKHRVGFFNVSAENGEIWFPSTEHVSDTTAIPGPTLTLEGQPDFSSPSAALIEAAVDWLNPSGGPGFLILEHSNGSYTQAGGGKESCTVEWREYQDSDFRHWVAGLPGRDTETNITIPGNGAHFSIKANEQLSNENVKAILTTFAADKSRPGDFVWRDITAKFATGDPL